MAPPIVRGLEDRLAAAGYVALLGNTDGDDDREQLIFDQMRSRHVDGFMLATARLQHPLLAEAARAEIPVVLVNRVAERSTTSHRYRWTTSAACGWRWRTWSASATSGSPTSPAPRTPQPA